MEYSKLFFVLLLLVLFLIARVAEKRNSKFLLFVICVVLCLYSGLRHMTVGIDTKNYYEIIYNIDQGYGVYTNEIVFTGFCKWMMELFHSIPLIIFLMSSFTCILFVLRFWELRERCSFPFMLLVFMGCFFLRSMNIMRQFVAIAAIFWGTRFLDQRKYIKYILTLLLAVSFHTSAVIGFAIMFVYLFRDYQKSKKTRWILGISIVLALIGGVTLIQEVWDQYDHYFEDQTVALGLMPVYKLLIFIATCLLTGVARSRITVPERRAAAELDKTSSLLYCLGILITCLGFFYPFMDRIGLSLLMFEIPFWGQAIKLKSYRFFFVLMPLVFIVYEIYFQLSGNGLGIFPYHTIFWRGY
ncbi:MAG: EpsG family protein [Clostridia bacterium]|nr:EpsG family protein [Clostridia bacterium]